MTRVLDVTNTTTFAKITTTDCSLTSFLRLPPEVRIQIYGYLLISRQKIQYSVCPIKQCLVWHKNSWQSWIPHGLHPAILRCCRSINDEGTAILYSENIFEVERYRSPVPVAVTWALSQANLLSITKLSLLHRQSPKDRRTVDFLNDFPALTEVKITLQDVLVEEWITFLEETSVRLQQVKKFMLELRVSSWAGTALCTRWPRSQAITDEERCLWAYRGPFIKHQDIGKDRAVRWEFEQEDDDYARCHCVLGILTVIVE